MVISEIYLAKNYVSKEEWCELIRTISNYNGILRKWKIIIINDKHRIRYFVYGNCTLPPTLNKLNSFLLKRVSLLKKSRPNIILPFISDTGNSFVDILNYFEIKNKGKLEYMEISFRKLFDEKIKSSASFFVNRDSNITKYKLLITIPTNLLTINFEGNKRYFYKSIPKYLDINKAMHLFTTSVKGSMLKVDTFPYLQGDFYLNQSSYDFDKHSIIFGSSGCGKSKFISLMIKNTARNIDLKNRYKFVVLDPHASLEEDIGGIGKVIDFKRVSDSIDLFINDSDNIVSSTELLLELLKSLIADQFNSKLERVLRHSIHILLASESFSFSNLRKTILDLEYRNDLIRKLKRKLPSSVIDFFLTDFSDLKTKSYGEAISPIIGFIDEMEMIPVFNEQRCSVNLENIIHDNFLTIFSLDRVKLGDKVTKTISGLIMQQLLTLIQKNNFEQHIIFIVDEVAVVENPILCRFLSEARKYHLSLFLAGQYFNQISDDLKNAIFANVVNYYIFRISRLDANILVDNFNMKIPLNNTRDEKIKLLTELNNRYVVVRINVNGVLLPAFKAVTLDFEGIPRIKVYDESSEITQGLNDHGMLKKKVFKTGDSVNLRDILISNSSSRKVVK